MFLKCCDSQLIFRRQGSEKGVETRVGNPVVSLSPYIVYLLILYPIGCVLCASYF